MGFNTDCADAEEEDADWDAARTVQMQRTHRHDGEALSCVLKGKKKPKTREK